MVAWESEDEVTMFRIYGGTRKDIRCARIRLVSLIWSTNGEEFLISGVVHVRPTGNKPFEYRALAESLLTEMTLTIYAVGTSASHGAGRGAFVKRLIVLGLRRLASPRFRRPLEGYVFHKIF